jgi:hypothetical protein
MRQAGAVLHAQPIQLAHVLAAEILEEVSAHQLVAQRHQDPLLHLLAADRQVLVHVPRDRAPKHARRSRQYIT